MPGFSPTAGSSLFEAGAAASPTPTPTSTGPFSLGSLGPCQCGCSSSTTICILVCSTIPGDGYTIQLKTGSTVVDSCVTGSSGCCTFTETGTYTVVVLNSGGSAVSSGSKTLNGTTITIAL